MASRTAPGGQAREAPRRRAASWLVVTLLLLVAGLAYTVGAASYQVGTLASPGPGLFPVALGMLIVLACGVRLVAECVRPSPPPLPLGPEWWRVPAIGAIEGVAGPESANNAAAGGTLVPLLSLGVPFAPPTALLLGAFVIHGVQPGPLLMTQHPDVFWGLVASMYAGNVMLLILNLPLIGVFVSILRLPQDLLMTLVVLVSVLGVYSVNNSVFDLAVMLMMSLVGYAMRKFRLSPATLVLPLVIGTMMEESLMRTLILARGDPAYLLARPIALGLLVVGMVSLILPAVWRCFRPGRADLSSATA